MTCNVDLNGLSFIVKSTLWHFPLHEVVWSLGITTWKSRVDKHIQLFWYSCIYKIMFAPIIDYNCHFCSLNVVGVIKSFRLRNAYHLNNRECWGSIFILIARFIFKRLSIAWNVNFHIKCRFIYCFFLIVTNTSICLT